MGELIIVLLPCAGGLPEPPIRLKGELYGWPLAWKQPSSYGYLISAGESGGDTGEKAGLKQIGETTCPLVSKVGEEKEGQRNA